MFGAGTFGERLGPAGMRISLVGAGTKLIRPIRMRLAGLETNQLVRGGLADQHGRGRDLR